MHGHEFAFYQFNSEQLKPDGTWNMMKSKKLVTWALIGALAIGAAGCSQSTGPNQSGGTVIGAVAGGLIGSRFGAGGGKVAAVIAGTMLGGIVGSQIGKNMDDEARQQAGLTWHDQFAAAATAGGEHLLGQHVGVELPDRPSAPRSSRLRGQAVEQLLAVLAVHGARGQRVAVAAHCEASF
jgi:surface antigen